MLYNPIDKIPAKIPCDEDGICNHAFFNKFLNRVGEKWSNENIPKTNSIWISKLGDSKENDNTISIIFVELSNDSILNNNHPITTIWKVIKIRRYSWKLYFIYLLIFDFNNWNFGLIFVKINIFNNPVIQYRNLKNIFYLLLTFG